MMIHLTGAALLVLVGMKILTGHRLQEVVKSSYEAVKHYHECVKGQKDDGDRTGADFL